MPGIPQHLFCLTGLVCRTEADWAAVFPLEGVGGKTPAVMSAKEVTFVDESGAQCQGGAAVVRLDGNCGVTCWG